MKRDEILSNSLERNNIHTTLVTMSLFITSPPDFVKTSPPDFFELVPSARSLGRMNKIGTNAILLTQSGLKVGFKLHV